MTESAPDQMPSDGTAMAFLPAPAACGSEFEQVDWAGTLAVRVKDGVAAGLRFSDEVALSAARAALDDLVLDDDAPAYFSVKLGTPGRRHKTPMHYLYLGSRPAVGTRSLERLFAGLSAHLSAIADQAPSSYSMYVEPVLTPRGLLLVPAEIQQMATVVDRMLDLERFVFAGAPLVHLERGSGEVVAPEPSIRIDLDAATLARIGPSAPQPLLRPGRYPLAGVLLGVSADAAGPLSPAEAAFHAVRLLQSPYPFGAQSALEDVVALLDGVPVTGVNWSADEDLVSALRTAGDA